MESTMRIKVGYMEVLKRILKEYSKNKCYGLMCLTREKETWWYYTYPVLSNNWIVCLRKRGQQVLAKCNVFFWVLRRLSWEGEGEV